MSFCVTGSMGGPAPMPALVFPVLLVHSSRWRLLSRRSLAHTEKPCEMFAFNWDDGRWMAFGNCATEWSLPQERIQLL